MTTMQRREFLGHAVRATVGGGAALALGWRAEALPEQAAGTARRASVADYGADPTGQTDSTEAVQKAIRALAKRNARLVFPAGKYTFAASDEALMSFRDYEGLEIFGNGAELSFAGATRPLELENCKDLEIHDIIVDWTRPPFSQGVVRAVDERSITVAIDPAYAVTGAEKVQGVLGFDIKGKSPLPVGGAAYGVTGVESRGAQTLEIRFAAKPPFMTGMSVVVLHPPSDAAAIRLAGCEQILLETVAFHTSPGAAALFCGCHDISFDTVRITPHPDSGRMISTCGGGLELFDCTGAVAAQHALISGTGGAGVRVQQAYWRMVEQPDPQAAVLASADGRPAPEWLLPKQGAYMQLSDGSSLKLLGEIAVTKAEATPRGMRVAFTESLSPSVGKGTLFCLSATNQAQLKMEDCRLHGGSYAGLVAQSRARVSNSSFRWYAGPGVLMAPDAAHLRGPVVESVHITDCNFTDCNLVAKPAQGAITVDTEVDRNAAATPANRINEGITLQRNTFSQLGGPAIWCAGANWVDVESNKFSSCDRLRPSGAEPRAIVLRNLDESTVTMNTATEAAKIVTIDCTDKVKVSDNGSLSVATS